MNILLSVYVAGALWMAATREYIVAGEDGEGVISAAIAVLIMAFLGAAMWVAFNAVFNDAAAKIQSNVGQIGG